MDGQKLDVVTRDIMFKLQLLIFIFLISKGNFLNDFNLSKKIIFFINMDIQASLRVPRLILQVLKLTTI